MLVKRIHNTILLVACIFVASLLTVSCKNDDLVKDEMPIAFFGHERAPQEAGTRATGLETIASAFKVWGFKTTSKEGSPTNYTSPLSVMNCYEVRYGVGSANSTITNTNDWEYLGFTTPDDKGNDRLQTIKYWDFGATSYRFFGFAPADASTEINCAMNPYNTFYEIEFEADAEHMELAPYVSHLWFSNNTAPHAYGDVVTLEFMKPVTKVRFMFQDANGNYIPADQLALRGIINPKFAPAGGGTIVQKGKLTVAYAIVGTETQAEYWPRVSESGDTSGTTKLTEADHYYNVLPSDPQGDFQMSITFGGEPKVVYVPASKMSWRPNTQYTYVFRLTESDFEFINLVQVGVTEWREEESEHEIYNW